MRIAWWSIVGWGIAGALLWAGPAGAQGLPGCLRQLGQCTTSLGICQKALMTCEAEPDVVFPGDGVSGPVLSYHDNGDGTFTDNNTLLMWEVKTNVVDLHWWNGLYTWSDAYAVFLATLNTPPCFAGHCDWRLPTLKELQSIVNYSVNPTVGGETLESFPGVASPSINWSSTTSAGDSTFAFGITFSNGFVAGTIKSNPQAVRAVRDSR